MDELKTQIETFLSKLTNGLVVEYGFVAGIPEIVIKQKPVGFTIEEERKLHNEFQELFANN